MSIRLEDIERLTKLLDERTNELDEKRK